MSTLSAAAMLENLRHRYATKRFDPSRTIDPTTWAALEEAVLLAPSCYGLYPTRIVVVTDPELRGRLKAVAWNQPQITDASHLVVFARKLTLTQDYVDAYVDHVAAVRGSPEGSLDGFRTSLRGLVSAPERLKGGSVDPWARAQTYLALGFFLSAAANLGVDACPMEGFDADAFDALLGLREEGYSAAVIATAGYRLADDPFAAMKKVRPPTSVTLRRR